MFPISFSNPWLIEMDAARRRAPAWVTAVAGFALAAMIVIAGGRGAEFAGRLIGADRPTLPALWRALWETAAPDLFVFLPLVIVAVLGAAVEGRRLFRAEPSPATALAVGAFGGAGGYAIAVGLAAVAGAVAWGHGGITGAAALGGAALGALLTLVQAGAEEVYFRGWIQPVLCARWGPWIGVLTTAVIFALLHVISGIVGPLALANTALAGLVFGLVALRSGGIWAPIAAHTAWNWTEAYGLGIDPNPGVGPLGSLVDLDLVGGALWTGGASGFNASLAATLTLSGLVAILALWRAGARRA